MPLERVVFPHPGRYRFVLAARGRSVEGIPLHLIEVPEGTGPGSAEGIEGN
jgi:hypothetical protein